jgi:hypothetical protein
LLTAERGRLRICLEAELRTDGHAEIVVGTAVKEDVVTSFKANTEGPGEGLNSASWIDGKMRGAGAQADCGSETGRRILVGHAEVVEANFSGEE